MKSFAKPSSFARRKSPHAKQKGFIITIELILISTVLVIGTFVGVVAIRDALFKQYIQKQSRDVYVTDSDGRVLGKAIDYDEHEAPRIPYIDRTVEPASPDPAHRNYRALIGIRDDRFTSREPVYYDGANCTGTPCIKAPSDESADNIGIDNLSATGAVGYIYKLQDGPTYAIGRSPDGIKGYLFRETANSCPISPELIQSRYISQKVVTGSPCEAVSVGTGGGDGDFVADADTSCLVAADDPLGVAPPCECPVNFVDQNDVLRAADNESAINGRIADGVASLGDAGAALAPSVGTVCCPTGSVLSSTDVVDTTSYAVLYQANAALPVPIPDAEFDAALATAGLEPATLTCVTESPSGGGSGLPRSLVLKEAVEVTSPDDPTINAMAPFVAPFNVNLPADAGEDAWVYTLPGQEGPNNQ